MPHALPILYSFRRCPYAMRARLAICAASVRVELREVVLRNKPAAMIEASPKATVPVLILPDGTVIEESLDVMHWALVQGDPAGWWPADTIRRQAIRDLIGGNDGPFKKALDRYKYPNRYASETINQDEQRDIAAAVLKRYELLLSDGGSLVGDRPTLADFAILPFVRQFAHVDREWFYAQPWPNVIVWLDGFLASPGFAAIMAKHPPWQPGDPPTHFPPLVEPPLATG